MPTCRVLWTNGCLNTESNSIGNDKAEADSLKARKILPGCLLALIMVVLSFWIYTRHNQFAFFYHSDESAKVEQVMTRDILFIIRCCCSPRPSCFVGKPGM